MIQRDSTARLDSGEVRQQGSGTTNTDEPADYIGPQTSNAIPGARIKPKLMKD